ncbi:MAG: hypothetical protein KME05_01620 [Gloeocapsa sp. UFS-A4-WI-NPMV-4B04]|jgi:hypothetical protein|nr:hypothetical protein [Gloeocapsa sp. UFS-A4-WI-NPMV-4B04]
MSITITSPNNNQEMAVGDEIPFTGTAHDSITKVELFADDRWLLGQTNANNGNWSISYKFNSGGTRRIVAKGFSASNQLVDTNDIWLSLQSSSVVDLNMSLTTNFQLKEFVVSSTADRLEIDNTPIPGEIKNLRTLCKQILQPARDALGPLKITSGFRSAALNIAVGGSPTSAHRKGFAADIVPVNVGTKELAVWVKNNREFDQIILEFGTLDNPNWIHLSAEPRNRKEVLRATSGRNGTVYTSISNLT